MVCSIVLIVITNVILMFTLSLAHVTLWLGAVGTALGLGSLPGYLLTVSMDFVSRSDLVSSLVLVCISVGKVTTPPLIGYLFQHVSYTWFIYVSLIFALIMLIVCLILIVMMIYKARKTRKTPNIGGSRGGRARRAPPICLASSVFDDILGHIV